MHTTIRPYHEAGAGADEITVMALEMSGYGVGECRLWYVRAYHEGGVGVDEVEGGEVLPDHKQHTHTHTQPTQPTHTLTHTHPNTHNYSPIPRGRCWR
jgi:hypothetical protein